MSFIRKSESGTFAAFWYEGSRKRKKTFKTMAEAKRFLAIQELNPEQKQARILVSEILREYKDTETQKKKGHRPETLRIESFMRRPFAQKIASELTVRDIEAFKDVRMTEPGRLPGTTISPSSLRKDLTLLTTIFHWAIRRGYMTKNPVTETKKPKENEHRERAATEKEKELLMVACGWDGKSMPETQEQLVIAAFMFACATGMRSGEILKLEEAWIEGRVIHIPASAIKTESKRDVALSKEALRILDLVRLRGCAPTIFGDMSDHVRDVLYRRVRDRAGLGPVLDSQGRLIKEGLNFHDSRATFCTWAASPDPKTGAPRLDVLALARQTGHKNLQMLQRYYRASAEEIALRLDKSA